MMLKNKWLKKAVPAVSLGLLFYFGAGNLAYPKQQTTQIEQKKEIKTYQSELKESFEKLEDLVNKTQKPAVVDAIKIDKVTMYLLGVITTEEDIKNASFDDSVNKILNDNNIDIEKLLDGMVLLSYVRSDYLEEYKNQNFKKDYTYEEFAKAKVKQEINYVFEDGSFISKKITMEDDRLEGLCILLKIKDVPKVREYLEDIVLPSGVDTIISVKTQNEFSADSLLNTMTDEEMKDAFIIENYRNWIALTDKKEMLPAVKSLNKTYNTGYNDKEIESITENLVSFYKTITDLFMDEEQPIAIDVTIPLKDGKQARSAFSVVTVKDENYIWLGMSSTPYKEWKDFALKVAEKVDEFYK